MRGRFIATSVILAACLAVFVVSDEAVAEEVECEVLFKGLTKQGEVLREGKRHRGGQGQDQAR